jgi:hypothetical protein
LCDQLLPALRKRERTWGLLGNPAAFGQESGAAPYVSRSLRQLKMKISDRTHTSGRIAVAGR